MLCCNHYHHEQCVPGRYLVLQIYFDDIICWYWLLIFTTTHSHLLILCQTLIFPNSTLFFSHRLAASFASSLSSWQAGETRIKTSKFETKTFHAIFWNSKQTHTFSFLASWDAIEPGLVSQWVTLLNRLDWCDPGEWRYLMKNLLMKLLWLMILLEMMLEVVYMEVDKVADIKFVKNGQISN